MPKTAATLRLAATRDLSMNRQILYLKLGAVLPFLLLALLFVADVIGGVFAMLNLHNTISEKPFSVTGIVMFGLFAGLFHVLVRWYLTLPLAMVSAICWVLLRSRGIRLLSLDRFMRTSLFISLVAVLAGCSQPASTRIKADRPLTLEEKRIVEIARRAVATNDTWVDRAEFEIPKRDVSGWSVLVWRLPYTPGGHRVILIDEHDRVAGYFRGR